MRLTPANSYHNRLPQQHARDSKLAVAVGPDCRSANPWSVQTACAFASATVVILFGMLDRKLRSCHHPAAIADRGKVRPSVISALLAVNQREAKYYAAELRLSPAVSSLQPMSSGTLVPQRCP